MKKTILLIVIFFVLLPMLIALFVIGIADKGIVIGSILGGFLGIAYMYFKDRNRKHE